MARHDDIADRPLRELLERAQRELRAGQASEAVHSCSDAFLRLIELRPELLEASLPADDRIHHRQWPHHLGSALTSENGLPVMRFDRDRFSSSDAITYYEFTVDTALDAGE